jgi:hypothetical protein
MGSKNINWSGSPSETDITNFSDFVTYADRHSLSFYNGNFLVIVVDKVIYRTFTRNLLCLYMLA